MDNSNQFPKDLYDKTECPFVQDSLPIANVSRIMKQVLNKETKISKEAKECVQECVGEFIEFITSEASFICKNDRRKTVSGEDILKAQTQVGFDDYKDILQIYHDKYKQTYAKGPGDKNEDDKMVASLDSGDNNLMDNDQVDDDSEVG